MLPKRIVARLDIKGESLVKGVQLEGLRKIGNPLIFAEKYYQDGIDEILIVDVVASLYTRSHVFGMIQYITQELRVPITVIGGIRSMADAREVFGAGADKVGVNSQAIKNPHFLNQLADVYGAQAVVSSVEAKYVKNKGDYFLFSESGRNNSGINLFDWFSILDKLEVGEILLTSVDRDGMQRGPDLDLIKLVRGFTKLPLIYSGGISNELEALSVLEAGADALGVGSALHYGKTTVVELKHFLETNGMKIRLDTKN